MKVSTKNIDDVLKTMHTKPSLSKTRNIHQVVVPLKLNCFRFKMHGEICGLLLQSSLSDDQPKAQKTFEAFVSATRKLCEGNAFE